MTTALQTGDIALFQQALKDVIIAHGGVANVATASGLNNRRLYRILSGKKNLPIEGLITLLNTLGLRLIVTRGIPKETEYCE